jgi:hypothetical protein
MSLTLASWFSRGQDLLCFPDDPTQAKYLQFYQAGNVAAVVRMLEKVFAGAQRMPALNWLAFPAQIAAAETATDDGPPKMIEDYAPADFLILPWGGGPGVSPSLISGPSGWGVLLQDLASSFLFLPLSDKQAYAAALQGAALRAGTRACGLSDLARGATAASFLAAAAPASPALQVAAPYWAQAAGLAGALRARAETVVGALWGPTVGGAQSDWSPLTLYALRSAATVAEVGAALLAATNGGNANLMQYLMCQDYSG